MLIAAIGIAAGFVLLIIPGIYLAVKLYFVPQTVVIEGARRLDALRQSSDMVRGFWWRTFGLVVLINLAAALPALVITAPFTGRTGLLQVHPGNLVRANDTAPIVTINRITPVYVSFAVPEALLTDFKRYMGQGTLTVEAVAPNDERPASTGRPSRRGCWPGSRN